MQKVKYRWKLPIGGVILDCVVLDDGTRILPATSVFTAFWRPRKGLERQRENEALDFLNKKYPNHTLQDIPPFLTSKAMLDLLSEEDIKSLQSIEYIDNGIVWRGYKCEILPEICSLYLEARRTGILDAKDPIANQAEVLLSSFAKVGISALIDEATWYQYNRKHDALRILLGQYIEEWMQKWLKRFPDEFFVELDKLYGNSKTSSRKRPLYYGKFINTYIYNPIEHWYVKAELDKQNITDEWKRKARFHQWLTDFWVNQLTMQIGRVLGIMEMSKTIDVFKRHITKQKGLTVQESLFDIDDEELFGDNP